MSRSPRATKTPVSQTERTSPEGDVLLVDVPPGNATASADRKSEPAAVEVQSPPEPSSADIAAKAVRLSAGGDSEALLFNYVFNHGAPKEKRLASFRKIFDGAVSLGHHLWPQEIKSLVWGKDVLDFGCGATLYGPVIRALGARSYTGVDKAIKPEQKRFRSRVLRQTVSLDFSMSDVAHVIPQVTYMQADDVISRKAFDIVLMQSVSHQLMDPNRTFSHIHRSLRDGGEIWILHDNFHAWAGHQQMPKSLASYDPDNPAHQAFVDWGHVNFEPPEDHPFRALNRLRLGQLRSLLDRYFEVDGWKEIPEKSSITARLTPEVRARTGDFEDRDLLTRQVVIRGVKR